MIVRFFATLRDLTGGADPESLDWVEEPTEESGTPE